MSAALRRSRASAWALALALAAAIVALLPRGAAGAVVLGIDLGATWIKTAFVQPGKKWEIVLNENSKRKTPNAFGLDRGSRMYGDAAAALTARLPEHVFQRSRDVLGVGADSDAVQHLVRELHLPLRVVADASRPGLFFLEVEEGGQAVQLRPEEVVGQILAYVRHMSEHYTGQSPIVDCVLTVPVFFSQRQREALLQSAEVAGLNVLTLVDENTAAAVELGIYEELAANVSRTVLLYNMGSGSTKVTVFRLWGKPLAGGKGGSATQVDVLSKAWDSKLGGDYFDMALADMMVEGFDAQCAKDGAPLAGYSVRSDKLAFERIRTQANKVKTVLSANLEIPMSVESLHKGKDLKQHVTRAQYEARIAPLLARVTRPAEEALARAGLTVQDVTVVELIGGGVRVPGVRAQLAAMFGSTELGNHLNGDEAKAFGAVFIGANISKAFRVRHVGLTDISALGAVSVELRSGEDWNKDALLFNASAQLGSRKIVSFKQDRDISLTLVRQQQTKDAVAHYTVKGVQEACAKFPALGKPKLSLTFLIALNDTVQLQKAEALFVEGEDAAAASANATNSAASSDKDGVSSEDGKGEGEAEGAAGSAEAAKPAEPDSEAKPADAGASNESGKADNSSSSAAPGNSSSAAPGKPKKTTHRVALSVERVNSLLLPDEVIAEARKKMAAFEAKELEQRQHAAAKSDFESFIFSARDKVRSQEELVDLVLSSDDKDKLFEDLTALEDWLDEGGRSAALAVYKDKRSEMEQRIARIHKRIDEMDQRPATAAAARKLIATVRTQLSGTLAKERPWVTDQDKTLLEATMARFEQWLTAQEELQRAAGLMNEPVLTAQDIASRLEDLHELYELVLKKPPPRQLPKKKADKEEQPAAAAKEGDTAAPKDGEGTDKAKAKPAEEDDKDEL